MELVVSPGGIVRCVYGEELDLGVLGQMQIRRASSVEPDESGRWWAHLSPAGVPKLGPFDRRSEALAAEVSWLTHHYLVYLEPKELE